MRKVLITVLAFLCSGCGGILIPDRPEEYRQGREHGCSSGHVAGGNYAYTWKSDHGRDILSPSYLKGWQAGFAECKATYTTKE